MFETPISENHFQPHMILFDVIVDSRVPKLGGRVLREISDCSLGTESGQVNRLYLRKDRKIGE